MTNGISKIWKRKWAISCQNPVFRLSIQYRPFFIKFYKKMPFFFALKCILLKTLEKWKTQYIEKNLDKQQHIGLLKASVSILELIFTKMLLSLMIAAFIIPENSFTTRKTINSH